MATSESVLRACEKGELDLDKVLSGLQAVVIQAARVCLMLSTAERLEVDSEFALQDLRNLGKAVALAVPVSGAELLDVLWPTFFFAWQLVRPGYFNAALETRLSGVGPGGKSVVADLLKVVTEFDQLIANEKL